MPYITQNRRAALHNDSIIDRDNTMQSKGDLNYKITELMIEYVLKHGLSYTNGSNASGAARDAALEFDRRILSLYENKMMKKHGDVYQPLLKLLKKVQ